MNPKLTYEQPIIGGAGVVGTHVGIEEGSTGKAPVQPVGAGMPDVRVDKPSFKPKGTSITLYGCGRRDGSDVNNSMGLVEAYRWVVLGP